MPLVFRYTDHAEYQLFNRNITKSAVELTVIRSDAVTPDKEDATVLVATRETSVGVFLKVWYRIVDGASVVQTALIITVRRDRPNARKRRLPRRRR